MKIRALSSFSHPQEGARAEGLDTKRCWIPMDPHRRATQTRLLRLDHAVKCRRQRSPCRRQQLRREALPACALLHRVQALGSVNLNRLKLVLVSTGCNRRVKRICPSPLHVYRTDSSKLLGSIRSGWRQSNVSSKLDPLQRHLSARKSNRLSKAGTRLKGRSFVQYPDSTSHRRGRR